MVGAWPFHDHYKTIGDFINRGLFGGIVVLPREHHTPPRMALFPELEKYLELEGKRGTLPPAQQIAGHHCCESPPRAAPMPCDRRA